MAPPGGPIDKTPPELIETIPAAGTVNFIGGRVVLLFSEYIDEKTIQKGIDILPTPPTPPNISYRGKRIFVDFPDSLLKNQTYIIVINRSLSDEHNVKLAQGIQVAFSTGNIIDKGTISGRVNYSKNASVHLWKILDNIDSTKFYKTMPDYVIDASDEGDYHFKFLSPGEYKIVAVDRSVSGLPFVLNKMICGLSWQEKIRIKGQEEISNINIQMPDYFGAIKMTNAEFIKENWGQITFTRGIDNFLDDMNFKIIKKDSLVSNLNIFGDPLDGEKLNFKLDESINDYISIKTSGINRNNISLVDSGLIRIKMDTTKDTTYLSVLKPDLKYIHSIESGRIIPLKIIFSSLIELDEDLVPFSILKDSIPIPFKYQLESPQLVKISPKENWKPKTLYNINIFQKGIIPIYGKGLNDSLLTIDFNTSDYQGFGSLKIKIIGSHSQDLVAELREFKKEKSAFRTVVNSEGIITMNYIPEGNYSLMFFQDIDEDLEYSFGNIDPYSPSEWFYNYPDTVKIRSNWEIELNQSNIEFIY